MSDRLSSLVADRRARVPFALVGVLLLVAGSAYATGVVEQGIVSEDRSVEAAMERADADATAALQRAAREASHDAAAEPVTAPAENGTDAVGEGSAFTDAYRIRLALAAAEALSAVESTAGDVDATVSMPAVVDESSGPSSNQDGLAAARDRVTVESVANGTATQVTFANVTTRATRDGRTVGKTTRNRTVVVAVPTLAAHDRVETYESRLNRGPLSGPGLGRQLTASLYPMAWARGYAQYAGAPVRNVVGNRHVELSTNAGIVRTQRDVFGVADPDARGGVARATARTGIAELLEPTGVDESSWSEAVLDAPTPAGSDADGGGGLGVDSPADATDEETTVSVDAAADEALVAVHDDLDALLRDAHRVEAELSATATRTDSPADPEPKPPGDDERAHPETDGNATGWKAVDRETSVERRVTGDGVPSAVPDGTVERGDPLDFGTVTREVTVERTVTVRWERTTSRGVERETTAATETEIHHVRIAVEGRYAPAAGAPDRPTVASDGGANPSTDPREGGPMAEVPADARTDLDVADAAGVDAVAREATVEGEFDEDTVVYGAPTEALADEVAGDLDVLHDTVRNTETTVDMTAVAASEADPYGDLAASLRADRDTLLDVPATYDGVSDRATVAARAAYLAALDKALRSAAADDATATDGLDDAIGGDSGQGGGEGDGFANSIVPDGASLGDVVASREAAREPEPHAVGEGGPGGNVTLVPNGSPGYLPRTAVRGNAVEGVEGTATRPLATRNLNYVTVPYGDVADGIVERLLGDEDAVRLPVAARALADADRALAAAEASDDAEMSPERAEDLANLRADRNRLADRVGRSLSVVDGVASGVLREHTSLPAVERKAVVAAAGADYDSRTAHALAVGNGTHAERVAAEAAEAAALSERAESRLAAELRVELREAEGRDAVTVPASLVDVPTKRSREVVRGELEGAIEDGTRRVGQEVGEEAAERGLPEPVRSVGAGLPVAPVPGYWVATVNAWRVEVRGEYPRFALGADVGPPGEGRGFEYVREAGESTVAVGEGTERERTVRLGITEPVRFETGTLVAVAVPAGPPGVGDVDGTRNETSTAWPCPETAAAERRVSGGENDACPEPARP